MSTIDRNQMDDVRKMQSELHRIGYRKKGYTLALPGQRFPLRRETPAQRSRRIIEECIEESSRQMRDFWDWYEGR